MKRFQQVVKQIKLLISKHLNPPSTNKFDSLESIQSDEKKYISRSLKPQISGLTFEMLINIARNHKNLTLNIRKLSLEISISLIAYISALKHEQHVFIHMEAGK